MEQFNIDKGNLSKLALIIGIIGIIVCIFIIISNLREKNFLECLVPLISIFFSVIFLINRKKILEKIDPPDPICAGYLDYLNNLEDHKIKLLKEGGTKEIGETDEELRKAAMATHNEIIIIERSYACACDGDDSNLPMEDRPSNKKSQWKNTKTNKIEEMTYKEYFTGMCDNNCKSENRPLTRCSTMDDCKFPGEICYQHPYLIENASENGSSPPRGICISNIQLFNLESMIDIYNSAFCELDANGSTDYGCTNIMDGADASDFRNTKKDIINYTLAGTDELICYSPFEEMKQISSYDEENQKYIIATSGGDNCCIPYNASTNSVSQIDKITDFLKTHEKDLLEGIGMIFVQDLFQIFVEEGLKTGWDLAKLGVKKGAEEVAEEGVEEGVEEGAGVILKRGGKNLLKGFGDSLVVKTGKGVGRTLLKGLLESRDLIVGGMKMALTGIKGMFEVLMGTRKLSMAALDLAQVMAQLLSKIGEGAKYLYELGKAGLAAVKGGPAAAKLAMERVGSKIADAAGEKAAAAIATKEAIAKASEEGLAMGAKAAGSAVLDAMPGIGQILFAVQMIGMAMDEADTGGFQNIVKNSDVIDQHSEQLEGSMAWMFKTQLNKTPPFTIDMVNTFFPPDKKDEGSVWPFNINLITGKDKTDAQNLIKLINLQKEATEKFTLNKLSEQINNYTDTIKDPDIGKTIMIELHDHANNPNLTKKGKKDKIQDYFTETISSFLKYDLTKADCEKRDQDIYDTMINKSGFTDDEKKKYINNTGSKFYYNKDALIYFNKELSSPEYSGIICTPKAIDLYNRYRNLREGQQYIAYSEFYLDISYSEDNKDYPNNLKHHMEKKNIKDSQTIKDLNLSPDNPIFRRNGMKNNKILGIPQYTMMNDIEAICQYGGMIGKPNYGHPGIHGMFEAGVSGSDLSKTWLQGGNHPTAKQPFGPPGCSGANCCPGGCKENYSEHGISEEEAKKRKDNYHNRIMSWNYADKSDWYNNNGAWGNKDNHSSERMKSPIAMLGANRELECAGCGMGLNESHAKVIDDDNRICIITHDYCQDFGWDFKDNNRYGGERPLNKGDLNDFDLKYGNNNYREYDDCHEGRTHTAVSWILGDSMTDEIARWL